MDMCSTMQNGFQFATGDGHCIRFLFTGWDIDNSGKYAGAIIGVFCMGLLNGILTYARHYINNRFRDHSTILQRQIYLTLVYGIQIVLGYWLMLLIMTYESGIFMSILLGLILSHFISGYTIAKNRATNESANSETNPVFENEMNNTHLC